ncbi:GLO2-like protein [Mya arenaria]|uniref:GLO2-like protein n=1 Tax=Mya arenaria TaxID=6604 RepID=A0ABY7DB22_MYAAR|nr:GLO2-like protein [Mya arenaria]
MLKFGGLNFTAIHTPGHTVGHVSYFLDGASLGAPDWHEYAMNNLEFACHLEPDNEKAREKYEWYNPYLRLNKQSILRAVGAISSDETEALGSPSDEVRAQALSELRTQKDGFKYIQ